jgi:cysteinyl-tRNA synthetase
MSLALLGDGFDLHGGGLDLVFPHHENERAQAVATGRAFARHWVHNGLVMVGGEKMSKSLGNVTDLAELVAGADPRAYRLLVLRAHYRSPLEVSPATLDDAASALARVDELARRIGRVERDAGVRGTPEAVGNVSEVGAAERAKFAEAMDDDLGTPRALAGLLGAVRRANVLLDGGDPAGGLTLARAALELLAVLGLEPRAAEQASDEVLGIIHRRDAARAGRDFAAADSLRAELEERGWIVEDGPAGTQVRR